MSIKSRLTSLLVSALTAISVSACNPPMPPELQAQLADQYVSCEPGEFNLISPTELTVVSNWVSTYNAICGATGSLVDQPEMQSGDPLATVNAQITYDSQTALTCDISTSIPVALDGAVPVISLTDVDHLILSPEVLFEIFSGSITSWNDPKIVELNPDSILPSSSIVVDRKVLPAVLKSFTEWMAILDSNTWTSTPSLLTADANALAETKIATEPIDGTIGLYPYSFAASNSIGLVSIQGEVEVDPDLESLTSGATQLRFKDDSSLGYPIYDPAIAPIALQGDDTATTPWGAIFSTMLFTCNDATSKTTQAFARFVSRLDAQGSLVDLSLTSLGEPIRAQMLNLLSIGLASPSPIPEDVDIQGEQEPTEEASPMPTS